MIPSVEELQKFTVKDLKAKLIKLGISTTGRKADLVAKLHSYYRDAEGEQDLEDAPQLMPPTPAEIIHHEHSEDDIPGGPPPLLSQQPPLPSPPLPPGQLLVQQDMIEREKQRIFQQQQERIRQRQEEQQRLEEEKMMHKARQQQEFLLSGMPPPPSPPDLDEITQQKVIQQQKMIEAMSNKPPDSSDVDEELLRQQQLAIQEIAKESLPPPPGPPFPSMVPPLLPPSSVAPPASQGMPLLPPLMPPPISAPSTSTAQMPLPPPLLPPPPLDPLGPPPLDQRPDQGLRQPIRPLMDYPGKEGGQIDDQGPPPLPFEGGRDGRMGDIDDRQSFNERGRQNRSRFDERGPHFDDRPPFDDRGPRDRGPHFDDRRPPFDDRGPPPFDDRDDRGHFDDQDDRGHFDDRDDRGHFDDRDERGHFDDRDGRGHFDDMDDRGRFDDRRSRYDDRGSRFERGPHMRGPGPLFDNRGPPRPHFDGRGPPPPRFDNMGPPRPPGPGFNDRGPPMNAPPFGPPPIQMPPPPRFDSMHPPPPFDMRGGPPPPPRGMGFSERAPKPPTSEHQREQSRSQKGPNNKHNDAMKDEKPEMKLPMALEKVLAYKEERAQEMGFTEDEGPPAPSAEEASEREMEGLIAEAAEEEDEGYEEDEEEVQEPVKQKKQSGKKDKLTKNQRKKLKKKRRKEAKKKEATEKQEKDDSAMDTTVKSEEVVADIEYIPEKLELRDPVFREFNRIFEAFKLSESVKQEKSEPEKAEKKDVKKEEKKDSGMDADEDSDDSDDDEEKKDEAPRLSKKKLRKMNRLSVAELKQLVTRPDVVEMHDVTARDPKLLVYLKAYRNTVPVPRHWCFKRKYLQGKRGIIKPPFELPEFIKKTGIMEMRQALQEKEEQQTMKTKMRQKVRPKMGKIDIDYQKLHDAFFRWQTKPKLTMHGELYYEGKEFETKLKEKKPGELTEDLRTALGMPLTNPEKYPPPWLIAMQRYGPPPSYPHLKIPGLNCPIPEGCSFGYHAGGWGKPPVDETGKPLYGDVFGTNADDYQQEQEEEEIDRTPWGELESESEEESEEEDSDEEEEDEDGKEVDITGFITPAEGGLITPSGLTSIPTGMETPEMIELRKKKIEDGMEQGGETPALYTVLPEKKAAVGGSMMGSSHVYDIGAATAGSKKTGGTTTEGVAIALDPSELDLDTAAMAAKYEEQVREQQNQLEKEDFSDMVAEHAAKQKNKRKKQTQDSGRAPKKYKEFKF